MGVDIDKHLRALAIGIATHGECVEVAAELAALRQRVRELEAELASREGCPLADADALEQARQRVKPLVDRALKAEEVSADIMNFRMKRGEQ